MSIIVFGSINMDLVVRTPRLPGPGETLIGRSFTTVPGGKGANQAVAAARLGAETLMIGRVGTDTFGPELTSHLAAEKVDIQYISATESDSSGVAFIAVDDAAENNIIVVSGANARVGASELSSLATLLAGAQVLLLQLEVPLTAVTTAAEMAQQQGITVILDPAPAQPLPPSLLAHCDILTPNETEAGELAGFAVDSLETAARAAAIFQEMGVGEVIIKMGGLGAFLAGGERGLFYPAFPVTAVDTVAAGDAFNGGLAAALSEGMALSEALTWGMAAGALAVTKTGAQDAMPTRAELTEFLKTHSK